jgi:MFS family permease
MAGPRRRSLRDRLGLPALAGRRNLVAAQLADSLGDGAFIPSGVVYFLKTTSLPLHTVGLSLSIAGGLALPAVALSGWLADRFSAALIIVIGNFVSAVAFALYLTVAQTWQLVMSATLAAVGTRLFGTANLALVSDAADPAEQSQWIAFLRAVYNVGFGLGGLLGSVAVGIGTQAGYRLLPEFQAASCLLAGALVIAWQRRSRRASRQRSATRRVTADRGGYRIALADRGLTMLAATTFLFMLCIMTLEVLVPPYLIRDLHQGAWLAGTLFTINTVIVAASQTVVARAVHVGRPTRVLQAAAVIYGAAFLVLGALGVAPRAAAIPGVLFALVLYTAAELIQNPTLTALIIAIAPDTMRGRYLAVYRASWSLGQTIAPALLTWLLTRGRMWPFLALTAICASIALVLTVPAVQQLNERDAAHRQETSGGHAS